MNIQRKKLDGLFEITLDPKRDDRGFFMRLFDDKIFRDAGLNTNWQQESRSFTAKKNTLRGLHVSLPPSVEGKMIHALHGKMLWVSVDLRLKSKTFGQWDSIILDGQKPSWLVASRGFGHGCLSLEDSCDLLIKADTPYSEIHGTGIRWDDPELKIDWKLETKAPLISPKDQTYGSFQEFQKAHKGIE